MIPSGIPLQIFGGAGLIFVLLLLVFFVGGLAVWLGLTYWVYQDAQQRRVDSPVLWAVVTFFVGPVGAVIYLLIRGDV